MLRRMAFLVFYFCKIERVVGEIRKRMVQTLAVLISMETHLRHPIDNGVLAIGCLSGALFGGKRLSCCMSGIQRLWPSVNNH